MYKLWIIFILVIFIIGVIVCKPNTEKMIVSSPVLIRYASKKCAVCQAQQGDWELFKEFEGSGCLTIKDIDVDQDPHYSLSLGMMIDYVPKIVLYPYGLDVNSPIVFKGEATAENLAQWIGQMLRFTYAC